MLYFSLALSALLLLIGAALFQQLRLMRKQITLHNFADYTKRYQEIIRTFPEQINGSDFVLHDHPEYRSIMRAMRAYFDLSYEEYVLAREKLVPGSVWTIWQAGIRVALSKAAFRQAWVIVRADTTYSAEFTRFADEATGS